jgi:hypothetical protein
MTELTKYIEKYTLRGACVCGQCCDCGAKPYENQPKGHTADLIFFKVAINGKPNKDELLKLVKEHEAEFGDKINILDGKEHSFIEVGGWIGDQGYALMLMGLGSLLGCWELLTPRNILGKLIDDEMVMKLAGVGMVTIKTTP